MIRILVVDDEPIAGLGIAALLREAGFDIVDTVASMTLVVDRVRSTSPDVVVCDVMIERRPQGLELRAMLAAAGLGSVPVLHLSSYDMASYVQRARDAGAAGYLPKTVSLATLTGAVEAAVAGRSTYPAKVSTERLPSELEASIMTLVAAGYTGAEIGIRGGLTAKAVDRHLARLYSRYGARSRLHLAMMALDKGWISRADVEAASRSTPPLQSVEGST